MTATITANTMVELKVKIYAAEGWKPKSGENRTARVMQIYDLRLDLKANKFKATKKPA